MKEGEFPGIPQPGFNCLFLRVPGKDSVYCPGSVFFCSDTQIEIIIIIISLQQLLLSEELHIKPTAVESSHPSTPLAYAESPVAEPPPSLVLCPLPSGLNRSPLSPLRAPSPPGTSQALVLQSPPPP